MPKGVEHIPACADCGGAIAVQLSVMPKGVEHYLFATPMRHIYGCNYQ